MTWISVERVTFGYQQQMRRTSEDAGPANELDTSVKVDTVKHVYTNEQMRLQPKHVDTIMH